MAVTITDHRTVINEADDVTGWVGTTTLGTADPVPIESTGWVGAAIGVAIVDSYVAYSGNLSNAVIYCWVFSRLALGDTTSANGGLMVCVGDATNLGAWKVAGADRSAFRHDDGPTGWQCPALDTTALPASPLSRAGSAASVNFASVTRVGTTVNSLVAAPGMNPNYNADIIRALNPALNNGCALSIIGGTSGNPGKFSEIAAADRSTGNQQAYGLVRQLATGAFGCQGPLRFGNATGTDSSWFQDANVTFVFEGRGFRTTLYKFFITDNGTGTTTFILTDCTLIAPPGVGASFDSQTDTDVTAVTVTGTRIEGFTQGVLVGGGAGQVFTNCIFSNGGVVSVTSQPVNFTRSSVTGSTVAADASSMVWNVASDPDGLLDDMTFSKGTNAHHAIEFGTTSPTSITLRDITFTGFNAANGQTDSALHIKRTTGDVTITVVGGSTPSYKSDGANVTLVTGTRTVKVAVTDISGPVTGANVFLAAAAGGQLPSNADVTITRSGTTATVSHTAHGMITNDKVNITGITDKIEDNTVHTITRIDDDSYSYTTTNSGSTSYTGTIKGTFVFLKGTATAGTGSNEISMSRAIPSDQPITGWARKSTSAPYYKQGAISGTVSSTGDTTFSPVLISDD